MKIYFTKLKKAIQNSSSKALAFCLIFATVTGSNLFSQISYSFTPCGATGQNGPTQAQANTAYASTNLNGNVTVIGLGVQVWTVPVTGAYRIEAYGAEGGASHGTIAGANGGMGAIIKGDFNLIAGQTLSIVVGQKGGGSGYGGAGGGGSYVVATGSVPLCVAGGGGGALGGIGDSRGCQPGYPGLITTSAGSSSVAGGGTYGMSATGTGGGAPGIGGTNGYGGGSGVASAGGGFLGDGANGGTPPTNYYSFGGKGFVNGSQGGAGAQAPVNNGGFGGGGGTQSASGYGGGGGGYSGGGGGSLITYSGNGGGGGSYNAGTNQNNTAGGNLGAGLVIITSLCNVSATASSTVICSGSSVTLTTNAASGYSWSTGNTTSSVIMVSPTVTTTYSVSGAGTNPSGCAGNAVVTITVSPGTPTLVLTSNASSVCLGNTVSITAGGALTYTFAPTFSSGVAFTPPAGNTNYSVTGANGCGSTTSFVTISVAPLPILITASSTLVCASTPATLTASGATNYTWSPGANTSNPFITNPASATIYTVIGQTGPCSGVANIAISTKPNPILTISASSSVVCSGNSTNLSVTGNALTYTWNPGGQGGTSISVSPTTTTLYSVVGTNSVNCISAVNQVVLVNANPVISASVSDPVVCSGGSATLSALGTNSFLWSTGAITSTAAVNPTANTTYSVIGTNTSNCSGSATVAVNVFIPTVGISNNIAICTGSTALLSGNGADTYTWSNGAFNQGITVSPSVTTVYTMTGSVTDPLSNIVCPATNSVQVTVNQSPVVTATADHSVICLNTSAVLTAGGASTYTWTGGSGAVLSSTTTVSPIANQTYSVAGIDANGCRGVASLLIQVTPCVGISGITSTAKLSIYPNPNNGEFVITSNQDIALYIINELGQEVKAIVLNGNNREVKVSNLANGIYFVTGQNADGCVKEKIVITK